MYQEKLDYMIKVGRQLRDAKVALGAAIGKKKKKTGGTFSDIYGSLDGLNCLLDYETALRNSDFHFKGPALDMLQADYQFSDNPDVFSVELSLALFLFSSAKGKDPQADFLAMRVLFHAGRVLKGLEVDGVVHSDRPTKGGKSKRKGYINDQVYSELFYSIDIGRKSRDDACKRIIAEATKREEARATAKNEKPKKVKSPRTIGRILKKDLAKTFPK